MLITLSRQHINRANEIRSNPNRHERPCQYCPVAQAAIELFQTQGVFVGTHGIWVVDKEGVEETWELDKVGVRTVEQFDHRQPVHPTSFNISLSLTRGNIYRDG